ncbi:MAG: hypothetical protein ABJP02_17650 [Parasphingorhabdus sp.]|uniref:hypothetical protein n=1 Tax=Parasphingorhabdus sp. TaxID=2709688 RepID=UPI0032989D15
MILRSKIGILGKSMMVTCLLAFASPVSAAEQWAGSRQIDTLYPNTLGLIFYVEGSDLRPAGYSGPCPGNRMFIDKTHPNYEVMASVLILAFGSSFPVNLNFENTTLSSCDIIVTRATVAKQ